MKLSFLGLAGFSLAAACVGTTGGDVIDFTAAAAGPADAELGKELSFTTDRGWRVTLTKAVMHVGAVYLDQSMPVSGSQNTSCILPGTYVAEVTNGLDVDILSPLPQQFPVRGHGTTLDARAGQVWLTGGDVNQIADRTPILALEGSAEKDGDVRPFAGTIVISNNHLKTGGELAGANPICKERIVSPIRTSIVVAREGGLLVRVDPRALFLNVDFGRLDKVGNVYAFSDDPAQMDPSSPSFYSQPSANLYGNLHAGIGLYSFTWDPSL
jgi:hypothetical protein